MGAQGHTCVLTMVQEIQTAPVIAVWLKHKTSLYHTVAIVHGSGAVKDRFRDKVKDKGKTRRE